MTDDKVAIVTGASSGIGRETVLQFVKKGYQVHAGARRLEAMVELNKHPHLALGRAVPRARPSWDSRKKKPTSEIEHREQSKLMEKIKMRRLEKA